MAANRRGQDVETGNPLSEFRFDGKGFSTVMVVEGGQSDREDLCWRCVEQEERERVCKGCGDPLCGDKTTVLRVGGTRGRGGAGDKWDEDNDEVGLVDGRRKARGGRGGAAGGSNRDQNKIYKNVSVKRVVEFLTEE